MKQQPEEKKKTEERRVEDTTIRISAEDSVPFIFDFANIKIRNTKATRNYAFELVDKDGNTLFYVSGTGQMGVGTRTPATSAKIDITSTTGALLLPRMTTNQRNALTAVNGMIIYNSTDNKVQVYENSGWANVI